MAGRKSKAQRSYGADEIPMDALALRVIRCPYDRAKFCFADLDAFVAAHPGVEAVLTSKDVPGEDCYGVIPRFADQSVFAHVETRYRGEAVAAIVGEADVIEDLDPRGLPVSWEELPGLRTIDETLAPGAPLIHPQRAGNLLTRGRVVRGNVEQVLAEAYAVVEGDFETGFVEHACIEPEAGFARRVSDQIELQACTQSPYMDRADIAKLLGISPEAVRIIPTAVGGGFGTKIYRSSRFSRSPRGI
jgi:aldehyde oxidoreductase